MEPMLIEGTITITHATRKRMKDLTLRPTLDFLELTDLVNDEKTSRAIKGVIRSAVDNAISALLYAESNPPAEQP